MHNVDYSEEGRDLQFYGGTCPIEIYIKLRQGVELYSGEEVTSQTIYDMLIAAYYAPSDTLLHKQWSPFLYSLQPETEFEGTTFLPDGMVIVNDYEFKLYPRFETDGKGWIDIWYSFTEPIAGIFEVHATTLSEDYAQGSGAYTFENFNITDGYVYLAPNENWALGTAPTQDVKFVFIPDDYARWTTFEANEVDVVVTPRNECQETMIGVETNEVEGNPLYLIINKNHTLLEDVDIRKAIAGMIPNDSNANGVGQNLLNDIFYNTLAYQSNGVWTKDAYANSLDLEAWETLLYEKEIIEPLSFTIASVANDWHMAIITTLSFIMFQHDISLMGERVEDQHELEACIDGWDFAIKEIEVSNLNSAYHELYGRINDGTDYMLRGTMYAANLETYAYLHSQVQIKLHNDASYINLGWQKKIISNRVTVSGVTFPTGGFSPTGDVSRIDFRGVTKI